MLTIKTGLSKTLFLSLISVLILAACNELQDVYFSTFDEAVKNGAVEKGIIPDAMPRSAHEIYESRSTDAATLWLKFKFSRNDIYGFVAQAEEVKPIDLKSIKIPSPRIRWWDRDLKSKVSREGSMLKVYKYAREIRYDSNNHKTVSAYFVVDWDSNIAYYWHEL